VFTRHTKPHPRLQLRRDGVVLALDESMVNSAGGGSREALQAAPSLTDVLSGRGRAGAQRGAIVCGVTDVGGADAAVDVAVELRSRLDLRLVLVAAGDGILDDSGQPLESVTTNAAREGARRLLERLLYESAPSAHIECRLEVGDLAAQLARVAREERADLVVVGSTRSRLLPGRVRVDALDELRMACPCPVVVVPSRPR
jgi:nucleotide-binding universal stress UspA family protein